MLQGAEEPYPTNRLSVSHFRAMFQDLHAWAGRFPHGTHQQGQALRTQSTSGRRCAGCLISLSTTAT
jgi:hypothetical protein